MNKSILMVVMVIGFSFMTFGQDTPKNQLHGYVEQETQIMGGKVTTQTKAYATFGGKTKVGGYCWAQASSAWGEAYCGPTYQVNSSVQVGVAVGFQSGEKRLQLAGFVWIGKTVRGHFVQNLFIFEKGSKWYRNLSQVNVSKRVKLGVSSQRFRGTGPELEIKLSNHWSVNSEVRFGKTTSSAVNLRYSF